MATVRKAPNKGGTTRATARKPTATSKKAEGVAVPVEIKPIVNRTGTLGGKSKPAAADTGGGKVKSASGAIEAVGSERLTGIRGSKSGKAMSGAATGSTRGMALGTKTGMRGRKDNMVEPGAMEGAENRMSRAIPVAKASAGTTKTTTAAKPASATAKSSTERARMAAKVSTGPKGAENKGITAKAKATTGKAKATTGKAKATTAKATGSKKRTAG